MPRKLTHEEFVSRTRLTHPNIEVLDEYQGIDKPIMVKCLKHNHIYITTPHRLKQGSNCQKCYDERRGESLRKDTLTLLNELNEIHNGKYSYPNVEEEYKSNKSKITIVCPIHGKFKQSVNKHLTRQHGCKKCSDSHMERIISSMLKDENFEEQKNFEWLVNKNKMSLDFFLKDYNLAIECQGEQHFLPRKLLGGEEKLDKNIERDILKKKLCEKHNIDILYIIPRKYISKAFNSKFKGLYNDKNTVVFEKVSNNQIILKNYLKTLKILSLTTYLYK